MKNYYFILTLRKFDLINSEFKCIVVKTTSHENLMNYVRTYKEHLFTFHICDTKKEAFETCSRWNDGFKQNGCYLESLEIGGVLI